MNKQISSNRWFIWAIVFIVVVGVGLWAYIQSALIEMDLEASDRDIVFTLTIHKKIVVDTDRQGAIEIAGAASECLSVGTLSSDRITYNSTTRTWWIDLERNPDPKDGCFPACVVNEDTKIAEVNWRCTGLLPE